MTSAWNEPVAHGRYGPWARKSANPYGIQVGALTSEGRVGAIPLEWQGMDSANSLFGKNQRAT